MHGSMLISSEDMQTPLFLSWRKLQLSRSKLKASSRTSSLLAGFAMMAMVEAQLDKDVVYPQWLLVTFAVCTTLLVAVHLFALMISTCILPHTEAITSLHALRLVHESPHEKMRWYIEVAWAFSTVIGLVLFLAEIALVAWIKLYGASPISAWVVTAMLLPIILVFVRFAIHFYRKLVTHKYEISESGIRELEQMREQLDKQDMIDHEFPPTPRHYRDYKSDGVHIV